MNKQQQKDADVCEKSGGTKDCLGCSCNVCLAQTNLVSANERLKEYISQLEHENSLLYGRLNNIRELADKKIK